jgi:hypothetical protein
MQPVKINIPKTIGIRITVLIMFEEPRTFRLGDLVNGDI